MAKTISISLPEDLYIWLKNEAEKRDKTIQKIIREHLEEIRALKSYKIDNIFRYLEILLDRLEEIAEYLEGVDIQKEIEKK